MKPKFSLGKKARFIIFALIFLFILLSRFVVVIDAGEVGVISTFGSVSENALDSGLHLKSPFSTIIYMPTRTQEYTMSASTNEGLVEGDDSIEARASDGALVFLDITVLYRLDSEQAPKVYKEIGRDYVDKIVRPTTRSVIREIIAKYPINEIYSTKRDEIAQKIDEKLTEQVKERGIVIEDTLLRNVNLTQTLSNSIEEKLTAQQEAQKLDFLLERESKESERKVIEATGQRDSQSLINQSLTDRYLYYLYVQSLKDRAGTIYVPTEGGVPLFKNVE